MPLSIIRGFRKESEYPSIHRFAQSIFNSEDFLNTSVDYDFFAGALLAPQITALGKRIYLLKEVKGEIEERINSLWRGPSDSADSTIFELLVAASCVKHGRKMEFLTATAEKTPDLRVHDYYFPTVVECKRKDPLSAYEIEEEGYMRRIFDEIYASADQIGLWGIFDLQLNIEAKEAPVGDISAAAMGQRLSWKPEKATEYGWGSIAFKELPSSISGPPMLLYSPKFLEVIFGWNSDIPTHDGMLCKVTSDKEMLLNNVKNPLALLWCNHSPQAIKKRSWTAISLLGSATQQVPMGEVGIIYICQQEGTRENIADIRTNQFIEQIKGWHHSGGIRIPVFFLIRLYPRILGDGKPDLIENGMRLMSELYGDPCFFEDFPTTVFHGES